MSIRIYLTVIAFFLNIFGLNAKARDLKDEDISKIHKSLKVYDYSQMKYIDVDLEIIEGQFIDISKLELDENQIIVISNSSSSLGEPRNVSTATREVQK